MYISIYSIFIYITHCLTSSNNHSAPFLSPCLHPCISLSSHTGAGACVAPGLHCRSPSATAGTADLRTYMYICIHVYMCMYMYVCV